MYKETIEKTTYYNFGSVLEFYDFITNTPNNSTFQTRSCESQSVGIGFNYTKTYEEAVDLLIHGWAPTSEKMDAAINSTETAITRTSYKSYYDVTGGQVSVSRHLAGMPTSMINRRQVKVPEKIVVLNKDVSYHCGWKAQDMMAEGIKALQIIRGVEATGARVKLNVVIGISDSDSFHGDIIALKICVKNPDQRLNLSQMAFPLSHPDMLRRLFLKFVEVAPEVTKKMSFNYGYPLSNNTPVSKKIFTRDREHYLPNKIVKNFIFD